MWKGVKKEVQGFNIELSVLKQDFSGSSRTRFMSNLCFIEIETFFSWGVAQRAMWCVHGVVVKMGSLGMETLKRDICPSSLLNSMIVRYPPSVVELITLLPGLSPRKLCIAGVGE